VITVDGQHFVLPAFSHVGHWFSAVLGVLIASLAIVFVVPVVIVLALVVPAALGGLGLALSLLIVALLLWPFVLLGRWLWKSRRKPITISA
jgi:protein-S-isoprenylcysteine O-methyltransferase Ste14